MLLSLLNIYLGIKLLGHVVNLYLTFWEIANCFQSGCVILHSHQLDMRAQIFHILANTYNCHDFALQLN